MAPLCCGLGFAARCVQVSSETRVGLHRSGWEEVFSYPTARSPAPAPNQAGQHPSPNSRLSPLELGCEGSRGSGGSKGPQPPLQPPTLHQGPFLPAGSPKSWGPQLLSQGRTGFTTQQQTFDEIPCFSTQMGVQQRSYRAALGHARKPAETGRHLLNSARILCLKKGFWCWKEPATKHSSACSPPAPSGFGSPAPR